MLVKGGRREGRFTIVIKRFSWLIGKYFQYNQNFMLHRTLKDLENFLLKKKKKDLEKFEKKIF